MGYLLVTRLVNTGEHADFGQLTSQRVINLGVDALLADQECSDRDEAEWEMLYENYWMALDADYNYDLYQPQEDMMEDDLKYMLMKYLKEMTERGDYHAKNLLWMMEMDYEH